MDTALGAGIVLAVVVVYVALMRWVLPRFGIET
jgi:hypothetical protein